MRLADTVHHIPRSAHCIGCGVTFDKMHLMINHRRLKRCGGRFLCGDERAYRMNAKEHWQIYEHLRETRPNNPRRDVVQHNAAVRYHYALNRDATHLANLLRQRRLS